MTDAPLRANPEDRPLPPSGGGSPASPSGGGLPASPSGSGGAADPTGGALETNVPDPAKPVAVLATAARRPGPTYVRPIGRLAPPPRDWRRAWAGFLIGVAALVVAIGLAWLLWDLAGTPKIAQAPAEPLPAIDLAEMEALLDGIGFPPGKIDGVIDSDATVAIRDFQAMAGLPVDGQASAALLEELRAAHIELNGGQ